jgi:hypothetical protein
MCEGCCGGPATVEYSEKFNDWVVKGTYRTIYRLSTPTYNVVIRDRRDCLTNIRIHSTNIQFFENFQIFWVLICCSRYCDTFLGDSVHLRCLRARFGIILSSTHLFHFYSLL